ncbi:MAG: NUDIX domain-containing protein [bacterium]
MNESETIVKNMPPTSLQVGVKIFLKNKEGKILLVKRSAKKYAKVVGNWDIVGRRIKYGTRLIDNLRREVKEETQLEIISEPILIYAQDIISETYGHIVRLSYVGNTEGDPVLDEEENVEYKWLTVSEIKAQEGLDVYVKEIVEKGLLN